MRTVALATGIVLFPLCSAFAGQKDYHALPPHLPGGSLQTAYNEPNRAAAPAPAQTFTLRRTEILIPYEQRTQEDSGAKKGPSILDLDL